MRDAAVAYMSRAVAASDAVAAAEAEEQEHKEQMLYHEQQMMKKKEQLKITIINLASVNTTSITTSKTI